MNEHQATPLAEDFLFLEAPRWHRGQLWVTDVFDRKIYKLDAAGRRSIVLDDLPWRPNSFNFLLDGTMVVVSSRDRKLLRAVDGKLIEYADLSGVARGHVNDFLVDEQGRIYVGNFGYDLYTGESPKPTDIALVMPDGTIRIAASGLDFPNGTVLVKGGRGLVVAETWVGRLTAFDRAEDGTLSNRRLFADLRHRQPDGICVDADDAVWAPCFNTGEVVRVLDGGRITDRIAFDGHAIACQLGGEDGKTLFCCVYLGTTDQMDGNERHGAILTVRVEVPRQGSARGGEPSGA